MKTNLWQNARNLMKSSVENLVSSFRFRGFRWYWLGNTVTHITFLLQGIVLGWSILMITDSAFQVGLVAFTYGLPLLIVSPLAELFADSCSRSAIIFISLGIATLTSVFLAYFAEREMVSASHILFASFTLGSIFAVYAPSRLAVLPKYRMCYRTNFTCRHILGGVPDTQ